MELLYNHYPTGWAWGFDTPFKYWKRWSGYEGGAATPFMMCGPGIKKSRMADTGIRKQYIHAVDLVPTLYEMCGVEPPEVVKGYTQNPIEGISFAYTFAPEYAQPEYQFAYRLSDEQKPKDANGKPKKVRETQFYSMLGTRGVWYKGWHVCTVHAPAPSNWGNFEKDIWELYCMDGDRELTPDPTQSRNLANDPKYADKLEQMKYMWFVQAGLYKGMPIDDRSAMGGDRPQLRPPAFAQDDPKDATFSYTYYPGGSEIPEAVAPNTRGRSYEIEAIVDFSTGETPKGVMIAHGGSFGGYSFYIYEGKLCYVYNWLGQQQQKITCPFSNLADEEKTLKVVFNKKPNQQPDSKFGGSTIGEVQLYINGIKQNTTIEEAFPEYPDQFLTQPGKFGAGFNIGRDPGQPVSSDYEHEFEFFEFEGAKLKKVIVTIKNDAGAGAIDPETELIGMLWRD